MTTDTFQRKLTAILSADVVGYSRLMGEDEESTVRTLNKYKQIIFDLIERHNGRLVDYPGDNVLAEFVSVVDAVRCGVQIQEDLKENNEGLPTNRKMEFRIGINVGDVIQDGDRIYGDGVNVAARIESLADPGGICLSRTAYDQVKKKLNYEYEYLGEYEVKNIDEPVRVYRVLSLPRTAIRSGFGEKRPHSLSDKLSIAVLPFANMSSDKEQEYFSDGLSEEIINALTQIHGLKVIARTSAFAFKGKEQDITKIAEALRVSYILEGSVRKSGNKLRVTAQLVKASDGSHVWSERYDREMTDIFAIQDEISQAIVEKLRVELEAGRPTVKRYPENVEAFNLYLKGRYHLNKSTAESLARGKDYFDQAIETAPDYALAWYGLALYYYKLGFLEHTSPKEANTLSNQAAFKALELDEMLAEAHAMVAILRSSEFDWKGTEREFQRALELNPKSSDVWSDYDFYYLVPMRRMDEAIALAQKALELDPLSPFLHFCLGLWHYFAWQWDQAIDQFHNALELDPHYWLAHLFLGETYIHTGKFDEAVQRIETSTQLTERNTLALACLGRAYAAVGRVDEAHGLLIQMQELAHKSYVSPYSFAWIYFALGETDRCLDWLEKAIDECESRGIHIHIHPFLYPLHSHPRFKALLHKMNLEQ